MLENSFLPPGKPVKGEFIRALLTLLICVLVLLVSANIPAILYVSKTQDSSVELKELSQFFGKNLFFVFQLIPFAFSLIALILCYKFIHKKPVLSLFTSRKKLDLKRVFLSFFIWIAVLAAFLCLNLVKADSSIRWNFSGSFFTLLSYSLVLVSIQTVFEEVLFRSFLLKNFYSATQSKMFALLGSSLLFGLMHFNNPEIALIGKWILIYFVGTGLFLGILTLLDLGLELAIGFHAANNLFAALILTNNWQVFQTDALFKDFSGPLISWDVWVNLFLVFPILIFFYGKMYKWDFGAIIAKFTKK